MSGLLRAAPWAAAAAGVAAAALFLVALLDGPARPRVALHGSPVAATARLSPADPQFGDPVVATVELLVDPARVDPAAVTATADLAPFTVLSQTTAQRTSGGLVRVRVVRRLACLADACAPRGAVLSLGLPRLRVRWPGGSLAVPWPAVRIHSRLTAAAIATPMLHVDPPVSDPAYRIAPRPLGLALLAAAVAAALSGAALLARALAPALRRRRDVDPIERLLAEVGRTGGEERRLALERLSGALAGRAPGLGATSRALAWAPDPPTDHAVGELAARVRQEALP